MPARRPPPDHEVRHRAVTDFESNLVVLAGAGTGKTSILVERVLVALGQERLEMGELAAITFTEKAAGEMRERLARGLDRLRILATEGDELDDRREADRAFGRLTTDGSIARDTLAATALRALEALSQARVSTIHGFCAEILRAYPMQAGVSPGFLADTGERFEAFREREWDAFLSEELGPEASRAETWGELLRTFPLGTIRDVALPLAALWTLDDDPAAPERQAEALARVVAQRAGALGTMVTSLLERQSGMTAATRGFFEAMGRGLEALERRGRDGLKEAERGDGALARSLSRNVPQPNSKLSGVTKTEFNRAARESSRLLRSVLEVDDELFVPLVDAVRPFAARARRGFLAGGELIMDGLLVMVRDLLREHHSVRRALKKRYRMLLVDEFQDTDPLQYEIVLYLAERGEENADDPYAAALEPGRLFIVGDPKQSIYRFRGADYAAFGRAVDRVRATGGEVLHLTANFRSLPEVIAPVNALFRGERTAWTPSAYQPEYRDLEPVKPTAGRSPRVEVWRVDAGPKANAEERRLAEGRAIAAWIRREVDAGRLKYGDVTVLLRAFTPVVQYLRPLREWEVPFVADGGRAFMNRSEVTHLMAALRTLARPSDPTALLAFLRSPAGAVPDQELLDFVAAGGRWDRRFPLDELDPERLPNIHRSLRLLDELDKETRDLSPDALVRHVLRRTRLLTLGGAAYEGPQRVANLRKLVSLASDLARDGSLSLNEILDALDEERVSEIEGDSPLADERTEAVRVMTVHKAKGLENEVVVVPDLAREVQGGPPGPPPPTLMARLPDGTPALSLQANGARNMVRVWSDGEERRHGEAEGIRLLYVALTRAKRRLVLLAGRSRRSAPWTEALRAWDYDPKSPPDDGETIASGRVLVRVVKPERPDARLPFMPADRIETAVEQYREALARLDGPELFRRPSGEARHRKNTLNDEEAEAEPAGPRDRPRLVGLAVHRVLELWDGADDSLLSSLDAVVRSVGSPGSLTDEEHAAVAGEVREILEGFLRSGLAGRFRDAEILGREVPLVYRDVRGSTWRGTLDLLYADGEGQIIVADYKTDAVDPEEAARMYGKQLAVYSEGVRRAMQLEKPPPGEIWLVRSGERVPVSLEEGSSH